MDMKTDYQTTMNIKDFYLSNYPSDELGTEINKDANFFGLYNELVNGGQVYEYLHVYDSLVRERLFQEMARLLHKPYSYIYNLWI